MKYFITFLLIGFFSIGIVTAQNIGINTTTPDPSSELDVVSTTKGVLVPRMTLVQRDAITNPATGLLIYQTDNVPGFYYFNGTAWTSIKGTDGGVFKAESDKILYNQTGDFGKSFLVNGTSVNFVTGDQYKMMFLPSKNGAFRVGSITNKNWDLDSIGNSSFVAGNGNKAKGVSSIALGAANQSMGNSSVTIGGSNIASGFNAIAAGGLNQATGDFSAAIGNASITKGVGSFAVGIQDTADDHSMAIGYGNNAKQFSVALGGYSKATKRSTAIGLSTSATGYGATAMGINTIASGDSSLALGSARTTAKQKNSVAIGTAVVADGEYASALGGWANSTAGSGSVVVGGNNNSATQTKASVFGGGYNKASGPIATVLGGQENVASGSYSLVAAGFQDSAKASYSTVLGGANNIVSGNYSTVINGFNNKVGGRYSIFMGDGNISKTGSDRNFVMGRDNMVRGTGNFIFGDGVRNFYDEYNIENGKLGIDSSFMFGYNFGRTINPQGGLITQGKQVTSSFTIVGALNGSFPKYKFYPDSYTFKAFFTKGYYFYLNYPYDFEMQEDEDINGPKLLVGMLTPTSNAWVYTSDSAMKENYKPADDVLKKIATMKLGSWNFKGMSKDSVRHYGPYAQEFYRNFGYDGIGTMGGDDKGISTGDIAGINMIAIQQLIRENEKLKERLKSQEDRISRLEALIEQKP